jgi:hypothetical protein
MSCCIARALAAVHALIISLSVMAYGQVGDLPAAVFLLDQKKIDEYRPLALAGDREKALAIYQHYSMFEDNEIDAEFWLRVLAEQNDCYATKEYVRRIKATPRLNTDDRIRYWKVREEAACTK